jgi:hypothetical protein
LASVVRSRRDACVFLISPIWDRFTETPALVTKNVDDAAIWVPGP